MGKQYEVNNKQVFYIVVAIVIFIIGGITMLAGGFMWGMAIVAYSIYLLLRGIYQPAETAAVFFNDGVSIKTKKVKKIFYFDKIVKIGFQELAEEVDHLLIVTKEYNKRTQREEKVHTKVLYEGKNLYQAIQKEMRQRKNLK